MNPYEPIAPTDDNPTKWRLTLRGMMWVAGCFLVVAPISFVAIAMVVALILAFFQKPAEIGMVMLTLVSIVAMAAAGVWLMDVSDRL